MNRVELVHYIQNSIFLSNVVTEESQLYRGILECGGGNFLAKRIAINLLGSVAMEDFYFKIDANNKIHLTFYDGTYTTIDLYDCVDIIDCGAFLGYLGHKGRVFASDNNDIIPFKLKGSTVESIEDYSFAYSSIAELNLPRIKVIPKDSFLSCRNLLSLKAENVETIEKYGITGADNLKEVTLPKCKGFGDFYDELYNAVLGAAEEDEIAKVINLLMSL